METIPQEWQAMSTSVAATVTAQIRERVKAIETMPSIPTIFLPLLDLLNLPPDRVKLDEVVKLVSYDNTIAAQCLRVASSPLFGLAKSPGSIKASIGKKIMGLPPGTTDTRSAPMRIPRVRETCAAMASRSSGNPGVGA